MKHLLLLGCLLLTACAPVVYVTPVGNDGVVLPEQAQRAIDAYTATARVMATQVAQATAAGQIARETATAASQGTLGALAAEQTHAALQLTTGAGAALVADTQAAKTQAAAQTQIWATPTAAAMARAVQATAAAAARRDQQDDIDTASRRLLWSMILVIGTVLALTLAGIMVWFFYKRQEIAQDVFHNIQWARVEQAQAETQRAQAEAVKACIVERDGRPYLITPGGLVAMLPEPVTTAAAGQNLARAARWRSALKRAVFAGIDLGQQDGGRPRFGERQLAGRVEPAVVNPDGSPSSAGYRKLNQVLRAMAIWATAGRDTVFAPGWDAARFEREFDHIPLPQLPDGEPPEVRIPLRSSAISAVTAVPQ